MAHNTDVRPILRSILLPLAVTVGTFFLAACEYFQGTPEITLEETRRTVLTYLMARRHGGARFEEQLYPDVNPVMYDPRDDAIYFALPGKDCDPQRRSQILEQYVDTLEQVVWNGMIRDSLVAVGRYRARLSDTVGCVCKIPAGNLSIDMERILSFPYGDVTYAVSLRELAGNLDNRYSYARIAGQRGMRQSFTNYGNLVSRRGEPSLARLTDTLLKDIPDEEERREERIQHLLDFVTNEVGPPESDEEGFERQEPLRRPTETLISGRGNSGNKSILFASLLEQIGEEYLLVYADKTDGVGEDISVAVPRGNFPKSNGHIFSWRKGEWVSCETTVPGFKIGVRHIPDYYAFGQIMFFQRPSDTRGVYHPRSGELIPLR